MPTVTLEVMSWLAKAFDRERMTRMIVEEPITEGETVRDLFERLATQYERFDEYVYDVQGGFVRGQVSVVINERMLTLANGLDTVLSGGDALVLIPAYAGGAQ